VIGPSVRRTWVLALTLAASGCALTFDSTRLGVPVSMAGAAGAAQANPNSGVSFRVTKHPVYLLAGLVPVSQPNLEDVLAGQVGAGARIENLRIRVRSRWTDLLVTVLTVGLVVPRSVTFEGTVVSK
jgi:hypothetical protein